MKERGIIFSAPNIQPIIGGWQTQTRRRVSERLIDSAPPACFFQWLREHCPYGKPGDRLWVRETWTDANSENGPCVLYRADDDRRYLADESFPVDYSKYPGAKFAQWAADVESGAEGRWRPSIFMPRWASRITLEIVSVRVERLQSISEADAIAEGIRFTDFGRKCGHTGKGWTDVGDCPAPDKHHPQRDGWHWQDNPPDHAHCLSSARFAFANLFESINGPESWDANPWVYVLAFRRHRND